MERHWYLARNGQVFGPVTDAQLMQSVAAGRILPTDQLNIAGEQNWWLASAIPGLLPQPQPEAKPVRPRAMPVAVSRSVRVTCFACFNEVSVEVTPGSATHCPKCRSAIEIAEPAAESMPSANQAAFAKLESPAAFKKRMQKKVADMQAAAAQEAAIAGGILGAVIGNT